MQPHLVGGLVGEDAHTAHGAQEGGAINGELVRVGLGDHRFVVGVLAIDQAAHQHDVVVSEGCVVLVEFDGDLAVAACERVLQQVQGFLGHNEAGCLRRLHIGALVPHQLVRIGGHEAHIFFGEFEEDPAHHRAQVVVASGEYGLVDRLRERAAGQCEAGRAFEHGALGELGTIEAGHLVLALLAVDLHTVVLAIDAEGERLFGEGL